MTKTMTKTKTQTKCLKNPTYAIFLKSWWLTHSKYDERYLTLAALFMLATLVTLFQSYNQFYRGECITVSGFFMCVLKFKQIKNRWAAKNWRDIKWFSLSSLNYFLCHANHFCCGYHRAHQTIWNSKITSLLFATRKDPQVMRWKNVRWSRCLLIMIMAV